MSLSAECEPGSGKLNVLRLHNVCNLLWRRWCIAGSSVLPRDDPLMTSWCKLLDAGLAACFDEWTPDGRTTSLRQAGHWEPLSSPETPRRRQLWVFWDCNRGETPVWERLVAPELEDMECGSWKEGVSDRCLRAMLAAFHCRLEKVLGDQGYNCVGRWFVKPFAVSPVEDVQRPRSTSMITVSRDSVLLSFCLFVTSGHWLCAAVDVKCCQSMQPLSDHHLQMLDGLPEGLKVLLCPSGLGATLRHQTQAKQPSKEHQTCLDEWTSFYPRLLNRSITSVPAVVEVEIQGMRMLHPSPFVLVQSKMHTGQHSLGMAGHHRQEMIAKLLYGLRGLDSSLIVRKLSHLCWENAVTASSGKRDFNQSTVTKPFSNSMARQHCGCNKPVQQRSSRRSQGSSRLHERRIQSRSLKSFHQTRINHPEPSNDIASSQPTIIASVLQHPVITQSPIEQEHAMPATTSHSSAVTAPHPHPGSILLESPLPSPFLVLSGRRPAPVNTDSGARSPILSTVPVGQRAFVFESGPVISRARVTGTPIGRPVDVKQSAKHVNEIVYKMEDHETVKASLIGEEANPYEGPLPKRKSKWMYYELPEDRECAINLERYNDVGTAVSEQTENTNSKESSRKGPTPDNDTNTSKKLHIDLTGEDSIGGMTPDSKDVFTPSLETPAARTPTEKRSRRPSVKRRPRAGSRRKSRGGSSRKESAILVSPFPSQDVIKPAESKPFISVSPLSPQPSPVSDVFQEESQIGPSVLAGSRSTLKSDSYVNLFDVKALEPSANDYLFNLLETDDDGISIEDTKSNSCPGETSQCSAMTAVSSNLLSMKHNKVDLSRIYPTPPSNDQTSPGTVATTDDPSTLKVSLERKAVSGQVACQMDDIAQDGQLSPIEVISLTEELLVSSVYDGIELPSEQLRLQFPLRDHSQLVYRPSLCATEDDGRPVALKSELSFAKEGTPLHMTATHTSPYVDMSRPLAAMAAMLPPPGIPVSRIRRASQLNSAGSPCSYHSPCYTPIHPPGESGMASVFSQSATSTNNSMRPTGLPSTHSLLINLLCQAHAHVQNPYMIKTVDKLQASSQPEWSKASSLVVPSMLDQRWTNRQVSMGFDVSDFKDVKAMDDVKAISDVKVTSFIKLAQWHGLASLCFQSGWGFLNKTEPSIVKELVSKRVTDPALLEQWLQHGSDLCDSRSIAMAPVSTTGVTTLQEAADLLGLLQLRNVDNVQRELDDTRSSLNGYCRWKEDCGPILTVAKFQELEDPDGLSQLETLSVPAVQVGFDGDILTVSPSALRNWGKLQLEPLSGARDVEYLVLTPEVNLTVDNINLFMKELSQVYEDYHFGKHTAVPKLRNGIMKIGKKLLTHSAVADQTPDKWFSTLGHSAVSQQLQMWAKAFRGHVVPYISNYMSEEHASQQADKNSNRPTLVVYFVDMFELLAKTEEQPQAGLNGGYTVRLLHELMDALPSHHRRWDMQFQVVPVEAFLDLCWHQENRHTHQGYNIHRLALEVYSQCRLASNHNPISKSLTNFGMSTARESDISAMECDGIASPRLYTPAFVISHESQPLTMSGADSTELSADWLFCSYSWSSNCTKLVCLLTDGQGYVLEPTVISLTNVKEYDSRLHCSYSAFKDLLYFCVDFASSACQRWHFVFTCTGQPSNKDKDAWKKLLTTERVNSINEQLVSNGLVGQLMTSQSCSTVLSVSVVSLEPCDHLKVISTPGDNSSACLLVLPSRAESEAALKLNSEQKKDHDTTSTFTELTTETISLSTGSIGPTSGGGLEDFPFSVHTVDDPDGFVYLQAGGSPLSTSGAGLSSVESGLLPFVNSPHPSTTDHQRLGSLAAETPTSDLGSMLLGNRLTDGSSVRGDNYQQQTHSSLALAYLFEARSQASNGKDKTSVMKASLLVCCELQTHSCQQLLRSIMRRLDALSWLSLDLTTGHRSSFLPFHQSVVTRLSNQVDQLNRMDDTD